MDNKRGIILIAVNNPFYGRLASNLCISIKATEPTCNVSIITDSKGRGISHVVDTSIFDSIIRVEEAENPLLLKLMVHEVSPYEETLFLDVDTVWLPKKTPSQLFDTMSGKDFQFICEGWDIAGAKVKKTEYPYWFNTHEMRGVYKIDEEQKMYAIRSEMMYMKKCSVTSKIFKEAIKIYKNPKKKVTLFGNYLPDEFALNIALAKGKHVMENEYWNPTYWSLLHKGYYPPMAQLFNDFYVMSVGGIFANSSTKRVYDNIMGAAHNKVGRQYMYNLLQKSQFIKDRKA